MGVDDHASFNTNHTIIPISRETLSLLTPSRTPEPFPAESATHEPVPAQSVTPEPLASPWGSVRHAYTCRNLPGFRYIWNNEGDKLSKFFNLFFKDAPEQLCSFRDSAGATLLHIAILNVKRDLVKLILEFCPRLVFIPYSEFNYTGETPLHLAVVKGDMDIIRMLSYVAVELITKKNKPSTSSPQSHVHKDLGIPIPDLILDAELKEKFKNSPEARLHFVDYPLASEFNLKTSDAEKDHIVGKDFRKPRPITRNEQKDQVYDISSKNRNYSKEGTLFYGGTILAFAVMAQKREVIKFLVETLQVNITYTDTYQDRKKSGNRDDHNDHKNFLLQYLSPNDFELPGNELDLSKQYKYKENFQKAKKKHSNNWRHAINLFGPRFEGYTIFHVMAHHGKFKFDDDSAEDQRTMFEYLKHHADLQLMALSQKIAKSENEASTSKIPADWCMPQYLDLQDAYSEPAQDKELKTIDFFFCNILNWRAKVYVRRNWGYDCYEYLTPTELAILHGQHDILREIKQLFWDFGPTRCIQVPLSYLYIPNEVCSLRLAVENNDVDTLSLPFFRIVLKIAWERGDDYHLSHRDIYLSRFLYVLILMIIFTIYLAYLPRAYRIENNEKVYILARLSWNKTNSFDAGGEGIFLTVTAMVSIAFLFEIYDIAKDMRGYFKTYLSLGFTRMSCIFRWCFYICFMLAIVLRVGFQDIVASIWEYICLGICSVVGWLYLTLFAKTNVELGPLLVVVEKVSKKDVPQWFILFFLVMIALVGPFHLFTTGEGFLAPFKAIILILFQQGDKVTDLIHFANPQEVVLWLFALFAILILMSNILIAMLNATFLSIRKRAPYIWLLQWAKLVLAMDHRNHGVLRIPNRSTHHNNDRDKAIELLNEILPLTNEEVRTKLDELESSRTNDSNEVENDHKKDPERDPLLQDENNREKYTRRSDVMSKDSCLTWLLVVEKRHPHNPEKFVPVKYCFQNSAENTKEPEWVMVNHLEDLEQKYSINFWQNLLTAYHIGFRILKLFYRWIIFPFLPNDTKGHEN